MDLKSYKRYNDLNVRRVCEVFALCGQCGMQRVAVLLIPTEWVSADPIYTANGRLRQVPQITVD